MREPFHPAVGRLVVLLVGVGLGMTGAVAGAEYYASPGGNDAHPGTLQQPFRTVQRGIEALQPGDTLYLRGGRYPGYVTIPDFKQGTPDNWFHMRSYPGEWAILDGGRVQARAVILYADRGHERCPMYWRFTHFEVTGGGRYNGPGQAGGGGISLRTAAHIAFEYLYIHDNYGGGATNDGGICLQNSDFYGPQNITIRFCHLRDNCDPTNGNNGNIVLFADYQRPPPQTVDIRKARQRNEIAFNLIEGAYMGIRSKHEQYLSLDNSGQHMLYADRGDRIHHNIVRRFGGLGIQTKQDFTQIHHNVVDRAGGGRGGICVGSYLGNAHREPFHVCVYNNLVIGADTQIQRFGTVYPAPLHPGVHFLNNIFTGVGAPYDGRNDLNLFHNWDTFRESDLQMPTIRVEANLFHPRAGTDLVINVARYNNDYSVTAYLQKGWSSRLYARSAGGLLSPAAPYIPAVAYGLGDGRTVGNGGLGGPHPYLVGETLPTYLGPADPDDHAWVAGVQSLANVAVLRDAGPGPPEWVTGGAGQRPHTLRVIAD